MSCKARLAFRDWGDEDGMDVWDYHAMVKETLDFAPEDAAAIVRGLTAWKPSAGKAKKRKREIVFPRSLVCLYCKENE